ncbi:MAG: protein kinase [Deltaproteobacteria bacterium]|nr:protein kinase [Deltaproteobacteria bacterium]
MAHEAMARGGPERLGRYEILGEIASGGMATVFLGRVTGAKGFQRLVAIKRLHPHLESEEEFVEMFLDEARLAARIRHPNVVATLDVEDDEHLYIVMEYIEGDRLLAFLRHAAKSGEKIPPNICVRIAMETLAALHAAHELTDDDGSALGLVHRDVSPQNILVSVDGTVKLVDFGIAKASARLSITRDGQLKGKIAYMAPEQTKRSEIDRRVDVFAMGIITWEMLTAKKLFNGDSDVEVLNQLLFEPIPRLRDVAPTVPAALDSVVARALERDPTKRFASAVEFADALERASKVFGGPASTKAVAAHLQKVSGDKLAKDRAQVLAGSPPVADTGGTPSGVKRRGTGQFAVPAGLPQTPVTPTAGPPRKATMVGMGSPVMAPTPRHAPPTFDPGPDLLDDDEDIPTSAIIRPKDLKAAFSMSAPSAPQRQAPMPSTSGFNQAPAIEGLSDLDEEPTAVGVAPTYESHGMPAAPPSPSMFAPVAGPRAATQQLPAVRGPSPDGYGVEPVAMVSSFAAAPTGVHAMPSLEPQRKSRAPVIAGVSLCALVLVLGGGYIFANRPVTPAQPPLPQVTQTVATPPAPLPVAEVPTAPTAAPTTVPAPVPEPTTPTVAAAGTPTPPVAEPTTPTAPTTPVAAPTPPTPVVAAQPTPPTPPTAAVVTAPATPPTVRTVRRSTGRRTHGGTAPSGGGGDLFGGPVY